MNRKEIVRFLNLCITQKHGYFNHRERLFFEVSVSKKPSIAPDGFAEKYHLDCILLDGARMSSKTPFQTHCIEIKSCNADFRSDNKWKNYIGRTDRLSFMALRNVIDPKDLPAGIGLIVPHDYGYYKGLKTIKRPKLQEVSIEARYDTMYGLAINTHKYNREDWTEKESEEHKKLTEKYLNTFPKIQ